MRKPMLPIHLRLLRGFLRLFFKLLYNQMAWTYNLVAGFVSLGLWQNWVCSVTPFLQATRVLELGHGTGFLQTAMLEQGQSMIGLDASAHMGRQASRRIRRKGYQPMLVNGTAQNLPFLQASFDRVVATFPSEYISDPMTLKEIRRVLAPGGKAIVLLLAWITGNSLLERATSWLFHFTGQSFHWEDHYLDPVRQAGFRAQTETIPLKNSILLVIVLEKIGDLNLP